MKNTNQKLKTIQLNDTQKVEYLNESINTLINTLNLTCSTIKNTIQLFSQQNSFDSNNRSNNFPNDQKYIHSNNSHHKSNNQSQKISINNDEKILIKESESNNNNVCENNYKPLNNDIPISLFLKSEILTNNSLDNNQTFFNDNNGLINESNSRKNSWSKKNSFEQNNNEIKSSRKLSNMKNLIKNKTVHSATDQMKSIIQNKINRQIQDSKLVEQLKVEANQYPGVCFILDFKLKIQQVNNQFTSKLLYKPEEITDEQFFNLIDVSKRDDFVESFRRINNYNFVNIQNMQIQDKFNNKIQINLDFKQTQKNFNTEEQIIIGYEEFNEADVWQIIDPNGGFNSLWTLIILANITFILFQIPYDISFGGTNQFNNIIDLVLLIIFTTDIVLNFFVGYDENNIIVKDFDLIVYGQLKGWFLIDLFATIPFDSIQNIEMNTQFIKVFKLIKLAKLLRMLKLSNYSFISLSDLVRTEQGKELVQVYQKNKGFLQFLKNNFQILFSAHFFTVFIFQLKLTIINKNDQELSWLQTQFNYSKTDYSKLDIQMLLMQENIKTSLGLGVPNCTQKLEIILYTIWMFFGLSLFGYGIGNISSYLNQANQAELEYQNSISQFSDLCSMHEIDSRISNLIMNDVDKQQEKWSDHEFIRKGKLLSNNVLIQLETNIYQNFIQKFHLFKSLSIQSIRVIKSFTHQGSEMLVLRNNTVINYMQLVIEGNISIQDDFMNLIDKIEKDEILGLDQFKKISISKYNIDPDQLLCEHSISKLKSLKVSHNNSFNEQKETNDGKEDSHMFVKEENCIEVNYPQQAIGSDHVRYMMIPFIFLEDMLIKHTKTFLKFQDLSIKSSELISNTEQENQEENMQNFKEIDVPMIILGKNGQIYDINLSLKEVFKNQELIGINITDICEIDPKLIQNDNIINVLLNKMNMKINPDIAQGNIQIINYIEHNNIRNKENELALYQKLKKSMVKSQIVELKVNFL